MLRDSMERGFMDKQLQNALKGFVDPEDTSKIKMPENYKCTKCGIHGHKMWRQYNTFADFIELMCVRCAEKEEKTSLYFRSLHCGDRIKSDTIGGLVPAIPDGEGSYWGYTSVPEAECQWWYNLPL